MPDTDRKKVLAFFYSQSLEWTGRLFPGFEEARTSSVRGEGAFQYRCTVELIPKILHFQVAWSTKSIIISHDGIFLEYKDAVLAAKKIQKKEEDAEHVWIMKFQDDDLCGIEEIPTLQ